MKFSTVILSASFLGLVCFMGDRVLDPDRPNRRVKDILLEEENRRQSIKTLRFKRQLETRELRQLKDKEYAIKRKIREAQSALSKLNSSERQLKQRLKELRKESASFADISIGQEAYRSSEISLRRHLDSLAEEKVAFCGLVEQLKSELASCRVKIDLWEVKGQRSAMEKLIQEDQISPLDDLKDTKHSCSKKNRHGICVNIIY